MYFSFFLAKRYVFSKKSSGFSFFISILSITGITIGVASLLITLSVMNGFHKDLRDKILGTYSDLTVFLNRNSDVKETIENLKKIKKIKGVAPYILKEALLKNGSITQGCVVKGIDYDKSRFATDISKFIRRGRWESLKKGEAVLGIELARQLGVYVGDEVYLVCFNDDIYNFVPEIYKFKIGGIFQSGMYEYDRTLFYIDIKKAEEIFNMNPTAIEIKIGSIYEADRVKKEIYKFKKNLWVKTWKETNSNLYRALKLEKAVMFIILILIIIVAIFNITSSLVFITIKKTKDIGLLKALGATKSFLYKAFILQGLIKGFIGIFLGNVIAIFILELLKKYQFIKLPPSVYYLNYLPVKMELSDFVLVSTITLFLCFISTVFPAKKASSLEPAKALRYE